MLAVLALSLAAPMALAEGNDAIDLTDGDDFDVDPGITPDSPFYGLDRAMERISLALTFNKSAKAQKGLKHAQERLAEVKAMIEAKKFDKAEEAGENYEDDMDDVDEAGEEINGDEDAEGIFRALCTTVMQQNRTEAHKEKVLQVKAGILERQAGKMSEKQLTHMGDVFSKIENRTETAQNRIAQRQENLKAKYKILTGMSDEEIDAAIAQCGVQTDEQDSEDESDEEDSFDEGGQQDQTGQGDNQNPAN